MSFFSKASAAPGKHTGLPKASLYNGPVTLNGQNLLVQENCAVHGHGLGQMVRKRAEHGPGVVLQVVLDSVCEQHGIKDIHSGADCAARVHIRGVITPSPIYLG